MAQLSDPIWRIQNLYLIQDKERHRRRAKLKPSQLRIVQAIEGRLRAGQPIRHYDLKCRQSMVTTFWMLLYLDDAIFSPNTRSVILAQQNDTLRMIWDAARFAHSTMPSALQPKLRDDSAKTLSFPANGSRIMVSLKVQGGTVNNLHVSEFPLCDPKDIAQTVAACPPDANITYEGVAEGMNHAHDKWVSGDDGFTRLFHPWFIQPEYRADPAPGLTRTAEEGKVAAAALRDYGVAIDDAQIQFRRNKKKDLGAMFPQEMAEDPITCFLSTGNPFFDGAKLQALLGLASQQPTVERAVPRVDKDGRQWWEVERWSEPRDGHKYVAGADVAEGMGADSGDRDYSVLAILDASDRRVAARLKARMKFDEFASGCDRLCRQYGNALLAVERNSIGTSVIELLREKYRYPNLWSDTPSARVSVVKNSVKSAREVEYGWRTTAASKPRLLAQLRLALEGEFGEGAEEFRPEVPVLDGEFLREAFYLRDNSGKLGAVTGRHDDLVMAWALAVEMLYRHGPRKKPAPIAEPEARLSRQSESSKLFGEIAERGWSY